MGLRLICALPNPGCPGAPRGLFYQDTDAGRQAAELFAQRENRPGWECSTVRADFGTTTPPWKHLTGCLRKTGGSHDSLAAYLLTTEPGHPGNTARAFYPDTPEGHARAEEFAQRENRPGRGVYDCIGKLKDGARSRNKETVAELDCIIADIDLKNIAEPSGQVLQTLRGLVLPPSEVRDSGFGLHAIWYLKEPASGDLLEHAEALMKRMAALLAADPAPTHRAALLRRPGTDNTKNGAPRKVCVIDSKATAYDVTELGDMVDLYDGWSRDTDP